MKVLIAVSLLVASFQSAWALEPFTCPSSCEGRWREGALMLSSSDGYGDAGLLDNLSTYAWSRPPAGVEPVSRDPNGDPMVDVIHSAQDIEVMLRFAAARCFRIKFLSIFSHGSPGAIYLGNNLTQFHVGSLDFLKQYGCLMADDARIELGGCNVADGCRGQNFMAGLATHLLPRGGSVMAYTFYSSTPVPGVIPHFSLNGDNQTLTVSRTGSMSWDNTPRTGAQCRDELSACLTTLDAQIRRLGGCRLDEAQAAILEAARRTRNSAGSFVLNDPTRFSVRLGEAALSDSWNHLISIDHCEIWGRELAKIPDCGSSSGGDSAAPREPRPGGVRRGL
jgi:hypothetical protein